MTVFDEDAETGGAEMEVDDTDGQATTSRKPPVSSLTVAGLDLAADGLRVNPVPSSKEDAFSWTQIQRSSAECAAKPETLGDIQDIVRLFPFTVVSGHWPLMLVPSYDIISYADVHLRRMAQLTSQ